MSGDRPELDALRAAVVADPDVPPRLREILNAGGKLQEIRLTERGDWLFEGRPVEHPRVRALFGRSLRCTELGNWFIELPPYTYPIRVDDAPYFIDRISTVNEATVGRLTSDVEVEVDWSTLETDGESYLGVRLADGHAARLVGPAYNAISATVERDGEAWTFLCSGRRIIAKMRARTAG